MPKPGSKTVVANNAPASAPVGGWLVLIFIVAFTAWVWRWQSSSNDREPVGPNDNQEVIDTKPDDKPDDKPAPTPTPSPTADLKDCVLIAVFDRKTVASDLEYTATIQNDSFWESAKSIVKDVEFLEDDDTAGKTALAVVKQPAPVVFVLKTKTKKLVLYIPFPKGGTSEIEKRLK
jgi:hypothetical protein